MRLTRERGPAASTWPNRRAGRRRETCPRTSPRSRRRLAPRTRVSEAGASPSGSRVAAIDRRRYFERKARHLDGNRHPKAEFHDSPVEQRSADLESVLHAHAIDLHQHVVRQIDFQVRVHRPLERALRRTAPVRRGDRLVRARLRKVRHRGKADERARRVRLHETQIEVVGGRRIPRHVFEQRADPKRARQFVAAGPAAAEPAKSLAPGAPCNGARKALRGVRQVAEGVAAERLVAAIAAQRDRDVLPRHRRDVVGGNGGGVGKRLVECADDPVEHVVQARLDDFGVVRGVKAARGQRRRRQLVVRGRAEADRRRNHIRPERVGHERDDQARVDTAGQERAERHFALEALPDALAQQRFQLGDRIAGRRSDRRSAGHPSTGGTRAARRRRREPVTRLELPNVAVDGVRRQDVSERQVIFERREVERAVPRRARRRAP